MQEGGRGVRASGVLAAGYCCHSRVWVGGHEVSMTLHVMHLLW